MPDSVMQEKLLFSLSGANVIPEKPQSVIGYTGTGINKNSYLFFSLSEKTRPQHRITTFFVSLKAGGDSVQDALDYYRKKYTINLRKIIFTYTYLIR
ncbi:MAG: hypothetical protein JZU72_00320 [Chlorobium phaeobacteroides]|jgi:hypothetical protein|nr:hypothetical protein [Chlorobium phaeobacteroides]